MAHRTAPKPAYSKYQQWCDAGKPYWTGVALANHVNGFPVLKKHLNAKESPWNRMKLDVFLRDHFSHLPAERLQPHEVLQEQQATPRPTRAPAPLPDVPPVPAPAEPPAKVVLRGHFGAKAMEQHKVATPGPEAPTPWSDSSLALPPFEALPPVLQQARLENVKRRRRAEELHDRLAEGIADAYERQDVVGELVQLMDTVMSSYDAERQYMLTKVAPHVAEDETAAIERMDLFTLQRFITNQLAPRVSRLRNLSRLRDGDALVEVRMRLASDETLLGMARNLLQHKMRLHQQQVDQQLAQRTKTRKPRPSP